MDFDFDPQKEDLNLRKHGIDFSTVPIAFADPNRILKSSQGRTATETRFQCIGYDGNDILTFTFTIRAGVVRVINAGYWRKGRKSYEQKKTSSNG